MLGHVGTPSVRAFRLYPQMVEKQGGIPLFGHFLLNITLEVDGAHRTECSMKEICNGYGLLCFRLMKALAVNTTDAWLKLNFASCVITSDTPIAIGVLVLYSISFCEGKTLGVNTTD